MRPQISIITINYNNKQGLLDTIKSVIQQSYNNYEFIIIDGNSTDGSKDVITEHEAYLTYSISEPDNGIYQAMNKGTRIAKGDYLIYLNSGDTFFEKDTLEKISPFLSSNADIIFGNMNCVGKDYSWIKDYKNEVIDFNYFVRDTLPHQGAFIKNSLINNNQCPYDETLKICSDWKFFIDAVIKRKASLLHAPVVIANYNFDGFSSQPSSRSIIVLERLNVLLRDYTDLFVTSFDSMLSIEREYSNIMRSRPIKAFLKIRRKFER